MESTVIWTAVALWFAIGWYMNTKLQDVHKKLDRITSYLDGLREYLYEIDPQFDDERNAILRFNNREDDPFAGADLLELIKRKESAGKRNLETPFHQQQ